MDAVIFTLPLVQFRTVNPNRWEIQFFLVNPATQTFRYTWMVTPVKVCAARRSRFIYSPKNKNKPERSVCTKLHHICLSYAGVHVYSAVCIYHAHTAHIYTHIHTCTHIHTHHTIMIFSHDWSSTKSLSKLGRNIQITRTKKLLKIDPQSWVFWLCCVLLCPFVCVRMYVSVCNVTPSGIGCKSEEFWRRSQGNWRPRFLSSSPSVQ